MNTDHELEQWRQEWQRESASTLDVEALLSDTHRRNRREKVVTAFEATFNLIVIAACLAVATFQDLHAIERMLVVALAGLTGWFSWWVYRLRRSNWLASPADATALLALERRRQLNRLRYWRVSLWLVAGLFAAVLVVAAVSHYSGAEDAEHWLNTSLALVAVVIVTGLLSVAIRKRAQRRLEHLDALDSRSR
ncbi:hypothetical protein [Wenzhouxiangella sp. EGI_FJ10409]|uniref:hypothetical protein n=1 Tax=Wenzhouxiangella sp. EGI_FJ10409 TaxID=3243767 RepID=UPI0035DF6026